MNPEDPIKEFKGKVSAIDYEKRIIAMKDEQGAQHPFKWTEPLDVVMQKWKPGFYLALKYDEETYVLKSTSYWQEGKDVWPKGDKGGYKGQPRNEKPMIYESAFKTCAELVRPDDFEGFNYAARVEAVRVEADKIAKWMITNGGA